MLRQILKALLASPAYTLTCIAVLALGIGANTAIFSVVYSVILRPLPYPDVDRLVVVWEKYPNMPDPPGGRLQVARLNFLEWQRQNTVFEQMNAYLTGELNETGLDHPERTAIGWISAGMLPMLAARPTLGRLFRPDEERKGSDLVAVISDKYFEKRFHRDPKALGRTIALGNASYTVIGVLPPRFHLPATWQGTDQDTADVWLPLSRRWNTTVDDERRQLMVIAKMKPGVTLERARYEMDVIADRSASANPKLNTGWKTSVFSVIEEETSPTLHRALYVLLGAVGFLLLIACANLANLTLARASLRGREIAVRLALGASRTRIVAQLLGESLSVGLAGAALGLVLAYYAIQAMLALRPGDLQRPELVEINAWVFGFATLIAVAAALLFGLAPSLSASRIGLNTALKSGGGHGASAARLRTRQFLIAAEVALALVLASGAGLMIRSFAHMVSTGIGFDVTRLIGVDVDLPEDRYKNADSRSRFHQALLDRARAIPGVESASFIDNLPLHRVSIHDFRIAGRPEPPKDQLPISDYSNSGADYFATIGLPVRKGRYFTDADRATTEQRQGGVVVVNESFERKFFEKEGALGQRLLDSDRKYSYEIVGVVADYHSLGVEEAARPQLFWPGLTMATGTLLLRTRGSPAPLANAIRDAVWSVDKEIPVSEIQTLTERLDGWQSQRKFNVLLMSIFAALALFLAMLGVYGVLANLVASRTREIGIRMAVGAAPAEIGRFVLSQSMIPVAIGLICGLAASLALAKVLESLLWDVQPRDPLALSLAITAILLVTPLAVWAPLRRAVRVDCTVALRDE